MSFNEFLVLTHVKRFPYINYYIQMAKKNMSNILYITILLLYVFCVIATTKPVSPLSSAAWTQRKPILYKCVLLKALLQATTKIKEPLKVLGSTSG